LNCAAKDKAAFRRKFGDFGAIMRRAGKTNAAPSAPPSQTDPPPISGHTLIISEGGSYLTALTKPSGGHGGSA
jgi:hypothetical protein